jgi:hypothetical protein
LFEHTHRQGNIAGVQIFVSFFVLGFAWREGTPLGARWVMFFVYFGFKKYFKIIRPKLKNLCEFKPAIVRLPQLVCKYQI